MLSEKNYEELLKFRNTLVPHDRKLNEREQALLNGGYIRIVYRRKTEHGEGYTVTRDLEFLTTTAAGEDALEEFEKESQREAKSEKQNRFNKKFSILQLFVDLIIFILGLVIANYSGLVSALTEFFGRWVD